MTDPVRFVFDDVTVLCGEVSWIPAKMPRANVLALVRQREREAWLDWRALVALAEAMEGRP